MPKDYKNTRRQGTREQSAPKWRYFFTGLVLGLGLSVGIYFFGQDVTRLVATRSMQAPFANPEPPAAPVVEVPKAKFDFYQVLPEMEVAVEEEHIATAPVVEGETIAAVSGPFVIQVASFRQLADADGVKASLALLGLEGHIQTVSINGETWHRVRLGPFNELDGLNDARTRLYENDFDAQVY